MAQFLRPNANSLINGWTANGGPSSQWECIDEAIADDNDFIQANNAANAYQCHTSNVTDPQVGTGHIVRIRYRASGSAD